MDQLEQLKAKILKQSEEDYMNEEQLEFFKMMLTDLSKRTLEQIAEAKEDITKPASEADPIDLASLEAERNLKLKLVDRQTKLLLKIDESLNMIEQGTYGYCVETGDKIGIERLLLRPTATMSVDAKAIREESEKDYGSEKNED